MRPHDERSHPSPGLLSVWNGRHKRPTSTPLLQLYTLHRRRAQPIKFPFFFSNYSSNTIIAAFASTRSVNPFATALYMQHTCDSNPQVMCPQNGRVVLSDVYICMVNIGRGPASNATSSLSPPPRHVVTPFHGRPFTTEDEPTHLGLCNPSTPLATRSFVNDLPSPPEISVVGFSATH